MAPRGRRSPPAAAADYEAWPSTAIRRVQDGLVVCDKPPGLPTTGRDLEDPECLQALVMARLGRRRVWAVHQLDRPTSGLCLMVTRKALVEAWQARLKPPSGRKTYLAVVHGVLAPDAPAREVSKAIGRRRRPDGRTVPALSGPGVGATKAARSVVTALRRGASHTLVAVQLDTGRTHQARLHLAHLGHPLVGEPLHRDPPCDLHPRLALHAWRLDLADRVDGLGRALAAPVPDDLWALTARLGLGERRAVQETLDAFAAASPAVSVGDE